MHLRCFAAGLSYKWRQAQLRRRLLALGHMWHIQLDGSHLTAGRLGHCLGTSCQLLSIQLLSIAMWSGKTNIPAGLLYQLTLS